MIKDVVMEMIKNMKLNKEEAEHAKRIVQELNPGFPYKYEIDEKDDADVRRSCELYIEEFSNTKRKGYV